MSIEAISFVLGCMSKYKFIDGTYLYQQPKHGLRVLMA
jgi:hypothetical protein